MRRRVAANGCVCLLLSGCAALFGPADGQFFAIGSVPTGQTCTLSLAAGRTGSPARDRSVSGQFRESYAVGPSRHGHTIALMCDGSVIAARSFRYGKDVGPGGSLAVAGDRK